MAQIEICDECGAEYPRGELVRKLRKYGWTPGGNYLLYSSYNSDFYTVDTSVDAGEISIGCYADRFRPRVAENSTTEARGSQTWTSSGTIRSTTSTDISALTNVCFNLFIGAYHYQTVQSVSVALGMCLANGTGKVELATFSVLGMKLCHFGIAVADIDSSLSAAAAYFYATATITGTNKWWADHLCVDEGLTPGTARPRTTGASIVRTDREGAWTTPVLCPECAVERVNKPSERYGKFRVPDWVEIPERIEDL